MFVKNDSVSVLVSTCIILYSTYNCTLWKSIILKVIISNDDLYKKAESALNKVDKAVDSVSNSGPITAVGVAANALF